MWVDWKQMTLTQKKEAIDLRPTFHPSDFGKFEFWIKPDGHVSKRRGGGSHRITDAEINLQIAKYKGEVRSKGDNRDWKPGVTFHFDTQHKRDANNSR